MKFLNTIINIYSSVSAYSENKEINLIHIFLAPALIISLISCNSSSKLQTAGNLHPDPNDPVQIISSVELPVRNADGIALGDITGNGLIDILTSEGDLGSTLWYEQGNNWTLWTAHNIHTLENLPNEIEGNAIGDFNSDGWFEAITLGQGKGQIFLHKHSGDPRGDWQTSMILEDRPFLQDAMVADIDGDGRPDLVYTWEGNDKGRGGINWLKLTGDDPLNPDHWQDFVMTQHESAWWLAPRRADLTKNNKHEDIIFSARNTVNRNQGARPGLFWMEPTEDVTRPWIVHSVDETLPHPLHVDMGDLSGDGHGLDLVVAGFNTNVIYWYEHSKNWKRHELSVPNVNGVTPDEVWNIKTIRLGSSRASIMAPVMERGPNRGALIIYHYKDGKFVPYNLRNLDYHHPMDDRIMLHDVTGDGQAEVFIPDSGTGADILHILELRLSQEQL